jgi:hypothetical protein
MKTGRGGFRMLQHLQLMQEVVHDPYKARGKPSGPTRCAGCGAVYRRGRWAWGGAAEALAKTLCPACLRVRQHLPAGYVTLRGEFFRAHSAEILKRVRACERAEASDHPLERIMAIEARNGGVVVTTTDSHLARRIGEALRRAYKGELRLRYSRAENLLRVTWTRAA